MIDEQYPGKSIEKVNPSVNDCFQSEIVVDEGYTRLEGRAAEGEHVASPYLLETNNTPKKPVLRLILGGLKDDPEQSLPNLPPAA